MLESQHRESHMLYSPCYIECFTCYMQCCTFLASGLGVIWGLLQPGLSCILLSLAKPLRLCFLVSTSLIRLLFFRRHSFALAASPPISSLCFLASAPLPFPISPSGGHSPVPTSQTYCALLLILPILSYTFYSPPCPLDRLDQLSFPCLLTETR